MHFVLIFWSIGIVGIYFAYLLNLIILIIDYWIFCLDECSRRLSEDKLEELNSTYKALGDIY